MHKILFLLLFCSFNIDASLFSFKPSKQSSIKTPILFVDTDILFDLKKESPLREYNDLHKELLEAYETKETELGVCEFIVHRLPPNEGGEPLCENISALEKQVIEIRRKYIEAESTFNFNLTILKNRCSEICYKIAQERKAYAVLDKAHFIYALDVCDITAQVIAAMNEDYNQRLESQKQKGS